MNTKFPLLGFCLLVAMVSGARADVEVAARLKGFDVAAAIDFPEAKMTTPASEFYSMPKVTITNKRGVIRIVREWPYATELLEDGTPSGFETKNLGVTLDLTVRRTAEGVQYFGYLELAELEKVAEGPNRAGVRDARTPLSGTAKLGEPFELVVATPKGKGTLELNLSEKKW